MVTYKAGPKSPWVVFGAKEFYATVQGLRRLVYGRYDPASDAPLDDRGGNRSGYPTLGHRHLCEAALARSSLPTHA